MASTTPNIGLTLPVGTEKRSRSIWNDNFTTIDTAIGTRNQGRLLSSSNTSSLSDFLTKCENYMGDNPGVSYLGYMNSTLRTTLGISFNGYVLGFYYTSAYKKIMIIGTSNTQIAHISLINSTWQTAFTVVNDVIDKYSGITWTTYATAANNTAAKIQLYKIGRICIFSGYLTISGTLPVDTVFCTVPDDCKPIKETRLIMVRPTESDANQGRGFIIDSSGKIKLHNGSSVTGGYFIFDCTWVTAS